jgi:hypothetical protein
MSGNVEVEQLPPVVSQDEEYVENAELDGWNREEVDRNDFFAVIFEDRAPGLRGWL